MGPGALPVMGSTCIYMGLRGLKADGDAFWHVSHHRISHRAHHALETQFSLQCVHCAKYISCNLEITRLDNISSISPKSLHLQHRQYRQCLYLVHRAKKDY